MGRFRKDEFYFFGSFQYGMEFKLHGSSEILHSYKSVKLNENELFYIQTFHNLDQSQLVFFWGEGLIF
jgi:hypothetical protein